MSGRFDAFKVRVRSRPEFVPAAITFGAIALFVGTGSRVTSHLFSGSPTNEPLAVAALVLNIAVILFAWRRHKDACSQGARRADAEERAQILSTRDQLTGLLVRNAMIEQAREAAPAFPDAVPELALILINFDRFKNVNEVYSHIIGDAVLRAGAAIVAEATPAQGFCARIGADEFCIIRSFEEGREREINSAAEHLLRLLGRPFIAAGVEIHLTASISLARSEADCREIEAVLRRANIAMNVAKKGGGNKVLWFDRAMESALKARTEIEAGLRRGVPLGEFVPYYQPQIDLATNTLHGFEALARWNHPTGGVIGPDVFIPVAEETGLIEDLFESILCQALADAKEWSNAVTLAVNVSPSQLKDPWLASKILKQVVEAAFPPERLEVEITESSLFENLALAQSTVESLKAQGIALALDDFGTGYSSLGNLRALPFSRIKIDRSFVQAMGSDAESLALVTAIARMADSLGLPVTAEGVGDEATAATLLEIGCDKGQGWYHGKPMTASDARRLVASCELLAHSDLPPKKSNMNVEELALPSQSAARSNAAPTSGSHLKRTA